MRTAPHDCGAEQAARLRDMVREATHALAHLDADRLENMAAACTALTRTLPARGGAAGNALALEAKDAAGDMAIFVRVLMATRDNLRVLRRLQALREGRLEYEAEDRYGLD